MNNRAFILIVFTLFAGHHTRAQTITNGAVIFVDGNALLSTDYPVLNRGFFQNEGTVYLGSDWTNENIYQGAGTLNLNGSVNQLFTHNGQDIAGLVIDNATGARLRGSAPVLVGISLINGILNTTQSDTLLLTAGAQIDGGSPASFIEGPLHIAGTGLRFFPVGNGATYLPVTLTDVSGGGSTITVVDVLNDFTGAALPGNITSVSRKFYWRRRSYNGPFTGSGAELPLYDDALSRTNAVILGYNTSSSSYEVYDNVGFATDQYYQIIRTDDLISESLLVLGTSSDITRDEVAFYIPNTLSPYASDLENRVIKVFGDFIPENFKFVVYDRRGLKVFESTDLERMQTSGWNGVSELNGMFILNGTYVYAMQGVNRNNVMVKKTGTITMIR